MRLINADSIHGFAKYIKRNENFEPYIMIDDLVKVIDEQPPAYDVEKVVEEFDKKYNNSLWIKGDEEFSITRNELIEIVKQGGVSDDN